MTTEPTKPLTSFRASKWQRFDPDFAEMIKTKHPDIWRLGGNIKGNDQYRKLYPIAKRGGSAQTQTEENALKLREAWVARHYEDFRIAGVIAQIKWLAVGSRGEKYMKDLVRERIARKEEREMKQSETDFEALENQFLEHFGVKGMKWGVRRSTAQLASARKARESAKSASERTVYSKGAKSLSTAELNRRIDRLTKEKLYVELNQTAARNGKSFTSEVLKQTGRQASSGVTKAAVSIVAEKMRQRFS